MADSKLPASADFYKQLSHEFQQVGFIVHVLEKFALQALLRGYECEPPYLPYIVEQLDVLVLKTQQLRDDLEKLPTR